ncbi:TRAP transporter small permease [Dietzia sp. NPDC055877]
MSDQVPEVIAPRQGSTPARRTPFGYLTDTHPRLDRIQNGISAFCAVIASVAIVVIVALTALEVFTRTAFDAPLGWNVGLVEQYLMMTLAFFGTVTAYRAGAHVAVVTIFEKTPEPVRKVLLLITYLIILAGLVLLVYSGTRAMQFSFVTSEIPPPGMAELSLPSWWWKSIIPVASGLGFVVVAIDLYRELTAPFNRVATDYEPGIHAEEI